MAAATSPKLEWGKTTPESENVTLHKALMKLGVDDICEAAKGCGVEQLKSIVWHLGHDLAWAETRADQEPYWRVLVALSGSNPLTVDVAKEVEFIEMSLFTGEPLGYWAHLFCVQASVPVCCVRSATASTGFQVQTSHAAFA